MKVLTEDERRNKIQSQYENHARGRAIEAHTDNEAVMAACLGGQYKRLQCLRWQKSRAPSIDVSHEWRRLTTIRKLRLEHKAMCVGCNEISRTTRLILPGIFSSICIVKGRAEKRGTKTNTRARLLPPRGSPCTVGEG